MIPRLAAAASFPSIRLTTVGPQEPNGGEEADNGSRGGPSAAALDVKDSQMVHVDDDTQEQQALPTAATACIQEEAAAASSVLPTPAQSSTRGGSNLELPPTVDELAGVVAPGGLPAMIAATGRPADHVLGKMADQPWQHRPYDKMSNLWQAAAQRRHMHRRQDKQRLGVASLDLSGPHEATPMPGHRVGSTCAHYFMVLTVKFNIGSVEDHNTKELKSTDEGSDGGLSAVAPDVGDSHTKEGRDEQEDAQYEPNPQSVEPFAQGADPVEYVGPPVKALIYVALLQRKCDAAFELQRLLAQVRAEHGSMPDRLVYRVHSDMGSEFCNKTVA